MYKSLRLHLRRISVRRTFVRRKVRSFFGWPSRRPTVARKSEPVLTRIPVNPLILKEGERIHKELERKILKANGNARSIATAKLVARNKLKAIERHVSKIEQEEALNPSLFGPVTLKVKQLQLREKYGPSQRRKRKSSKKGVGLQYKMPYYKGVRDGVRTRDFRHNMTNEECSNDLHWTEKEIQWLLASLVEFSFQEAFTFGRLESARVAEIMAWINRRFDDHPLSFDSCCRFAGLNPDDLREMFVAECKHHFGTDFPHYQVLRNGVIDAEYGNDDAIEWVLSNAKTPLSFVDCCNALGFNPEKARAQLLLPIVNHEHDQEEAASTEPAETNYADVLFGQFQSLAA